MPAPFGKAQENHVALHQREIELDARQRNQAFALAMIISQTRNMLLEGKQACLCKHPRLTHATTYDFAQTTCTGDKVTITDR